MPQKPRRQPAPPRARSGGQFFMMLLTTSMIFFYSWTVWNWKDHREEKAIICYSHLLKFWPNASIPYKDGRIDAARLNQAAEKEEEYRKMFTQVFIFVPLSSLLIAILGTAARNRKPARS